jgi:RHS repeat-associated protein
MGYGHPDKVRMQFTAKERDSETGLDYFGARYYSKATGRFTSADGPFLDQDVTDPQSWNLYSYVRNKPLGFVDPFGLWHVRSSDGDDVIYEADLWDNDLSGLAELLGVPLQSLVNFYGSKVADNVQVGMLLLFSRKAYNAFAGDPGPCNGNCFQPSEDKTGVGTLGTEWLSGRGPRERWFGPSSYMTKGMMTSPDVAAARRAFLSCDPRYCVRNSSGYRRVGPTVMGVFGWTARDGPVTADKNMPRQFVGSFYITISERYKGEMLFEIVNVTGLNSASFHILPDVGKEQFWGALSNTQQTYWWTEKIPK